LYGNSKFNLFHGSLGYPHIAFRIITVLLNLQAATGKVFTRLHQLIKLNLYFGLCVHTIAHYHSRCLLGLVGLFTRLFEKVLRMTICSSRYLKSHLTTH